MVYSFELLKHANIRYRESLPALATCELYAMLSAISVFCQIIEERLGGSTFLTFECRELSASEISWLSGHSSVVFMAENRNGALHPLEAVPSDIFTEDLPEILKYKGKTSPTFTRMMINTAYSLSAFRQAAEPVTFFDPICGRATGCFCALTAGMNAVGLDLDRKDVTEAAGFFSRYLQYHKLKHERIDRSETIGRQAVPVTEFVFSETREQFLNRDFRRLILACADTATAPALFRKRAAHIIAADLPYGIQHAPQDGRKPESLSRFIRRILPVWKQVLMPGGVIALSFNTLTLPTQEVKDALIQAGFHLPENDLFNHLTHPVEQAVIRNVVFALNSEED